MSGYQRDSGQSNIITIEPSTPQQLAEIGQILRKKLGPEFLTNRQGAGGSRMTYIEGWRALELANEIFGWDGNHALPSRQLGFVDFYLIQSQVGTARSNRYR